MTLTGAYPVLMSADVAAASRFYCDRLGFEPTFTTDWYVSLRRGAWELAVLDPHHESIPAAYRGRAATGVLVNLEVDDVDAEHRRLVIDGGLEPVLALRSEPFGQRHFILPGPDQVLIDVIQPIKPDPEWAPVFA